MLCGVETEVNKMRHYVIVIILYHYFAFLLDLAAASWKVAPAGLDSPSLVTECRYTFTSFTIF